MTRRFEIGPLVAAIGALLLLVSLFLDWYGDLTAWEAFEITDLLLAALALAALVAAAGVLAPELSYVDARWLPALAVAATVIVVVELISQPPAAAGAELDTGAWLALAAAVVMLIGAVLSVGKVSFSVSIEGRERRRRVAAVDHRQDTTETAAVVPAGDAPAEPSGPSSPVVPAPDEEPPAPSTRGGGRSL